MADSAPASLDLLPPPVANTAFRVLDLKKLPAPVWPPNSP